MWFFKENILSHYLSEKKKKIVLFLSTTPFFIFDFTSSYLGYHFSLYSSSSVYVTAIVSFVLVWFVASSGCSVWFSLVLLY